ncbi:FliM/FliN family flagellar motor switch protein [Glacieibacterium megasporae]|uniref:FliM/FliN family flagellar motor switch protein n=1 Tax=Glacieibacterium megasporae TaxID=2835787 RepID=UPI001C1DED65|nr:FliM/FliN family flagellar motor switch protein [Polymorphobacter megasporae]UAJ09610.1 FliM/FliN family flagellar motor switch protein [Polymorphobacter megasporae]
MSPGAHNRRSADVSAWRFPPALQALVAVPAAINFTAFVDLLGGHLAPVVGKPLVTSFDQTAPAPVPATGFFRGDGWRVAVTVPMDLVGALISVRCGGPFSRSTMAGAGGSAIVAELTAAILAAADEAWPGGSGWQSDASDPEAAAFAVDLTAGGLAFNLGCAVTPAPIVPVIPDIGDWFPRLHAALDATPFAVRAVLHDRVVPLAAVLGFAVGDVLPIETRRDVSLRLGDRALARGTITPDDDGGHRVTIVAVGSAGIIPAKTEDLP